MSVPTFPEVPRYVRNPPRGDLELLSGVAPSPPKVAWERPELRFTTV
ncbi:hypothetical protein STRIP9103_09583 [Streptomyces ipomoeae 91-03]|uniref:Uncharacterized protein n=1 Tax=Streptomyces ipomoeae 91-03 TaxID=698759 RepID=L1L3B8_9ACTN|nr:hypothetical protein STRIP9103_09583 [Streptomyces ipomoeae 91-03]